MPYSKTKVEDVLIFLTYEKQSALDSKTLCFQGSNKCLSQRRVAVIHGISQQGKTEILFSLPILYGQLSSSHVFPLKIIF